MTRLHISENRYFDYQVHKYLGQEAISELEYISHYQERKSQINSDNKRGDCKKKQHENLAVFRFRVSRSKLRSNTRVERRKTLTNTLRVSYTYLRVFGRDFELFRILSSFRAGQAPSRFLIGTGILTILFWTFRSYTQTI